MKKATRISRINKTLAGLDNYHEQIPLGRIFNALKENGFMPLQEDGTEWDGFLCGAEGQVVFSLADLDDKNPSFYYLRNREGEAIDVFMVNKGTKFEALCSLHDHTIESISRSEYETFKTFNPDTGVEGYLYALTHKPCRNTLALSWYKMPSGRYEVISYVS